MKFHQVYENAYPQHGSQFFLLISKSQIFFVEIIHQLKNFDMNFKVQMFTSLDLQIPPYLELILGNW